MIPGMPIEGYHYLGKIAVWSKNRTFPYPFLPYRVDAARITNLLDMIAWCDDLHGRVQCFYGDPSDIWFFELQSDAILFKLRW